MLAGYDHLLAAARRLAWDAEAIALDRDVGAATRLVDADREQLTALVAGFCLAEHAVANELAPYVRAAGEMGGDPAARECFVVQARDEARHARFFDRVADEVLGLRLPAAGAPAAIASLFGQELADAARARGADAAPETMAAAVGLYHLVLEGITFAVGQEALHELATRTGLSGVAEGVGRVRRDERWHVGLGVLHLQRLGAPAAVSGPAARAIAAWGPTIATEERVGRVLAAHRRRVQIVQTQCAPAEAATWGPSSTRRLAAATIPSASMP
jgi:ribonucleoside-diphosphate reductase beta chain